jgi:chromosomal replication initiation ATPase DnaA
MNVLPEQMLIANKLVDDCERSLSIILLRKVSIKIIMEEDELTKKELSKTHLQNLVCEEMKVSWAEIVGKSRLAEIVNARKVYSYLAYKHLEEVLKVIGEDLGGRQHADVIYYNKKAVKLMDHIQNIEKSLFFS